MEMKICGICCDELLTTRNYCITNCNHEFHTSCLYQSRKGICPYCREKIVTEDQLIGSSKGLEEEISQNNMNIQHNTINVTSERKWNDILDNAISRGLLISYEVDNENLTYEQQMRYDKYKNYVGEVEERINRETNKEKLELFSMKKK